MSYFLCGPTTNAEIISFQKKKKKKDFLDNRYDEFGHTLQELLALKDLAFNCSLPPFAALLIMPQISSQAQRTPFQEHLLHKHQEA